MTSLPAWAIGITTFGRIWVHYTFIIPGPMYMKTVLGFSIQKVIFYIKPFTLHHDKYFFKYCIKLIGLLYQNKYNE